MKLTKGMKKALSLLLSAAMVVTGVNVTTNTASATSAKALKWVGTASGSTVTVAPGTTNDFDLTYAGWSTVYVTDEIDFSVFENPVVTITTSEGTDYQKTQAALASSDQQDWKGAITYTGTETPKEGTAEYYPVGNKTSFSWEITETDFDTYKKLFFCFADNDDRNITSITIAEKAEVEPSEEPSESASAPVTSASAPVASAPVTSASAPVASATAPVASVEPTVAPTVAPTEAPVEDQDQAFLMFTDGNWSWGNWNSKVTGGFGQDVTITGDGDYAVSINVDDWVEHNKDTEGFELSAAEGANVFCVDFQNLCNSPNLDVSEMEVSNVKIYADNKSVSVNNSKILMGNIEGKGNYRMEIKNDYGSTVDDPAIDPDALTFKSSLKVTFTLSGIKEGSSKNAFSCDTDGDKKNDTFYSVKGAVDEWSAAGEEDPAPIYTSVLPKDGDATSAPTESGAPAPSASASAGAVATKVPTGSAVATPTAVTGTKKLTVAKSLVVVAPGKSTTVKYTAKKAAAASSAAVVKATSKSKKVATVSVKKAKKKIQIKVPKKAVKGASTTVTVKSTKLNGKAISAKIKVYVRNTAKKVKPAKKSISVKKGKKVKLVLKASGKIQNKKKPVAETITVKGKVLKLASVKYAKKKITLTLKGNKKAKKKAVTIKVGSKKVKVKATVK